LEGTVFSATGLEGEPRETDEAAPLWVPQDRIPYDRMWADDRIWMPEFLAGRRFSGRFLFDGDRMLGHDLEILPGTGPDAEA
jgi:8-oxo-dGTP diphosphatase